MTQFSSKFILSSQELNKVLMDRNICVVKFLKGLNFADSIPMVLTCDSVTFISCKPVIRYRALIRIRSFLVKNTSQVLMFVFSSLEDIKFRFLSFSNLSVLFNRSENLNLVYSQHFINASYVPTSLL